MLKCLFIFLGAVGLTAVLILCGLIIATAEEICKREVIDKMRWRDPDPGRDGKSVEHGKKIKRCFMSRTELRSKEAEKWFRRKPYERRNSYDGK